MTFQPLNLDLTDVTISLLRLLPGEEQAEITCEIHTASLNSKPSYETLSYVWGKLSNTRQITCDGSPRAVTESLHLALARLRRPDKPRTVWIDQICIDQTNEVEKSRQVSVMQKIYKNSTLGLIWLGELPTEEEEAGFSPSDVGTAFRLLRAMDSGEEATSSSDHATTPPRQLGEVILALMGSQAAKWHGIRWWHRIWTIQEAKLPDESDLLWGTHSIPFNVLKRVAKGIVAENSKVGKCFAREFALGSLGNEFCIPVMNLQIDDPDPIIGPLYRWRPREASNPLDKVYALMGLFSETTTSKAFESVPICDYTLSVTDLYTRVTLDLIKRPEGLLPLCGRRGEPRRIPGLPSWVVDWTPADDPTKRTTDYFGHCWRYRFFNCAADKYSVSEITAGPDAALVLPGLRADRIAVLGRVNYLPQFHQLDFHAYDEHTRRTISSWLSVVDDWRGERSLDEPYPGHETMTCREAFCRVMIGDLIYTGSVPTRHASPKEALSVLEYARGSSWNWGVAGSARDMVRSQAFFITERGYFGIGPPDAEIGDEVWVLFCGKVPHVLRRDEERDMGFRYIGDAYVQGIMEGEVLGASSMAVERVVIR